VPPSEGLPTRFCIRARTEREGWQPFVPGLSNAQIDFLGLVLDVPEVLSLAAPNEPVYRAAMAAPAAAPGSRVLVAVDDRGGLAIVGCPDRSVPGSYREMVAGILATGGRLWHWPYEVLVGEFEAYLGDPLEKYIAKKSGEGWLAKEFREGIEASLRRGHVPVLVAGAGGEDEAAQAFTYLQSMNIRVKSVGFSVYESDGVEVVVPGGTTRGRARPEPAPAAAPEPARPTPVQRPEGRPPAGPATGMPRGTSQAVREELSRRSGPGEAEPRTDAGTKPGVQSGRRPPPGARNRPRG